MPKDTEEDASCIITSIERAEIQKQIVIVEKAEKKRSKYIKWKANERAEVGAYAAKHGVAVAVRHFQV